VNPKGGHVTGVVLTLNEERHLPNCLDSLSWVDELIVLDSGSTDGTVEIAMHAGASVAHHPFVNYSVQRQHALSLCTTPWVLFVDADERTPPELASEVRGVLSDEASHTAGYWIPRQNVFWGHTMRGGGWWPDHQLRLLRVGRASFDRDRAVHEVAHVEGPTEKLSQPLLHLNYDSIGEFRAKQSDYARLDVARRASEGQKATPRQLITMPLREFWRRYVTLDGWRDGATGLTACALMAWFELTVIWGLLTRQTAQAGEIDEVP
jgi:glycosyltransferase involved in cell wall biosynthesis